MVIVTPVNSTSVAAPTVRRPLTRDLVVAEAARLVDRDGVDAVTMTRLAESLEVTLPALYNHVRGAQDCLHALALSARRELLRTLSRAARGRSGDDAVIAVAASWRRYALRHPGRYAATDRHPVAGLPDQEAAVGRIVALLQQVVASYGLEADTAEHGAWSLRAALHGFVALEGEQGHPRALLVEESFSQLVRLLCQGFQSLADASSAPPRSRGSELPA